MKQLQIIIIFICLSLQAFAQTDSLKVKKDTNKVSVGKLEQAPKIKIDTSQKQPAKNKQIISKKPLVSIDSTLQKSVHIPLKATLYSAVLPGLGQAYNKQYWKIPIIYGIATTLGFSIDWNNTRYADYRTSFLIKSQNPGVEDDNDPFPNLGLESVRVRKNRFRRDRDFLMIVSLGVYLLNVVDATVSGHLKDFDVSDKLSLDFEPSIKNIDNQTFMGVQVNLNLK